MVGLDSVLTTDLWFWLLGQVVIGAALWGGIRADIKGMHRELGRQGQQLNEQGVRLTDKYNALESRMTEAHVRIDRCASLHRRRRSDI